VEQTPIPVLSIQPLVENAIKHGVARRSGEGWLRLSAAAADGRLKIVIEDSGEDQPADSPAAVGAGVGLANVNRRLQLCFGAENGVTMSRGPSGTRVEFTVPLAKEHALA
jgi:two-component system LytT family sensor kinase